MPRKPSKPLEQIVEEVGRYPVDAFLFVQECIGFAAIQVHGPIPEKESVITRWMSRNDVDIEGLRSAWQEKNLPPDIARAIDQLGGVEKMNRHVTGQQLCLALRDTALDRWGLMARSVLARWKITCTEDIGKIIFALVDNGWLQKQSNDSIDDFNNIFDFNEAFAQNYRIE